MRYRDGSGVEVMFTLADVLFYAFLAFVSGISAGSLIWYRNERRVDRRRRPVVPYPPVNP